MSIEVDCDYTVYRSVGRWGQSGQCSRKAVITETVMAGGVEKKVQRCKIHSKEYTEGKYASKKLRWEADHRMRMLKERGPEALELLKEVLPLLPAGGLKDKIVKLISGSLK